MKHISLFSIALVLMILNSVGVYGSSSTSSDEQSARVFRVDPNYSLDPSASVIAAKKGMESEGLVLRAELAKSVIAPGDSFIIKLRLKNISQQTLVIWQSNPEADYGMYVVDASGKEVPASRPRPGMYKNLIISIQPGEELEYDYNVGRTYDFTNVGEYSITASRKVFRLDGEGGTDVVSNTVMLIVSNDPLAVSKVNKNDNDVKIASHKNINPTLIPARSILERHGFKLAWNARDKKLIAKASGLDATIQVGHDDIIVGGNKIKIGQPAKLVNGQLNAPGYAISILTSNSAVCMRS